jgi:hypothetical protein
MFLLLSRDAKPTWSSLDLADRSNSRTLEPGILLDSALAMSAVCENPRFLLLIGEEGRGTNTGARISSGQFITMRSANIGIRLVRPFSFIELMISEASEVYSVIARPLTPAISIGILDVGKQPLQARHSGEPNLLQSTHGVGNTKSKILDT